MKLKLFRVTIPCDLLVVARFSEDAVMYAEDDYDAQERAMGETETRVVQVTRENVRDDELQKKPYIPPEIGYALAEATTEQWLKLIEADERAEAEFLLKQLRLPGVE